MQDVLCARAIHMAKVGLPDHEISFLLGLLLSELRTRYGPFMRRAVLRAKLCVATTLFRMAVSGKNAAASIYWLKIQAAAAKTPAGKTPEPDIHSVVIPPVVVLGTDGKYHSKF